MSFCVLLSFFFFYLFYSLFGLDFHVFNSVSPAAPQISLWSEDAGIEPRTVTTLALAVSRSNHSARYHPQRLEVIRFHASVLFLN